MTQSLPNEDARRHVRGDAKAILAASTLPAPVRDLIGKLVRRTRLWKRERAAVAMELIAHFEDGIEASRSVDELVADFGDVKTAARLIRRGKVRNRPLWWHGARRIMQGIGVIILLYLAQMAILLSGQPEVKIDYAARLCEKAETIAEADRAWPIYREAWLRDPPTKIEWTPKWNRPSLANSRPGDPNWSQAVTLLQQHPVLLEAARAGGMKPGLGITIRERRGLDGTEYRKIFPADSGYGGILPELECYDQGAISQMVKLLIIDLRWAASQKDAARVVQDYRSIVGMLRQIRETPSLIGQLMALIHIRQTDQALADAVLQNPDLLSVQQYVELLHCMPIARDAIGVSTESCRAGAEDLIQRMYTDDGNGDGRLTREGAECFLTKAHRAMDPKHPSVTSALTLPLLSAGMASRREMTRVVQELYDLMERRYQQPLRRLLATPVDDDVDRRFQKMQTSILTRVHYWPLDVIIPQFTNVGIDVHVARARHDALTVALALKTYRRATGGYPQNLSILVPRYLPAIPLDPLANQPLLYALRDGRPVIYARGRDGIDHGGVARPKTEAVPTSGDWVLYPPQDQDGN